MRQTEGLTEQFAFEAAGAVRCLTMAKGAEHKQRLLRLLRLAEGL